MRAPIALATLMLAALHGPAPAAPVVPALSLMERAGDHMTWLQVDPASGQRRQVATLPIVDQRLDATWDGQRRRMLVRGWSGPRTGHLWELEAATGHCAAVPTPPTGFPFELAYDRDGAITAVDLITWTPRVVTPLTIDGRPAQWKGVAGSPAYIARVYRLAGRQWRQMEAQGLRISQNLTMEHELARLLPSWHPVTPHDGECRAVNTGPADRQALSTLAPVAARWRMEGRKHVWKRLDTAAGPVYIWTVGARDGGVHSFADHMATVRNGHVTLMGDGETLGYQPPRVIGPFVLAVRYDGRFPRLYDARSGRLLYANPNAHAAGFWPAGK